MIHTVTKSVDNIQIEIETGDDGRDYIHIHRSDLSGCIPPTMFPKGDEVATAKFLSSLAALFGLGQVTSVPDGPL